MVQLIFFAEGVYAGVLGRVRVSWGSRAQGPSGTDPRAQTATSKYYKAEVPFGV